MYSVCSTHCVHLPLRSNKALVATVVPIRMHLISEASIRSVLAISLPVSSDNIRLIASRGASS